MIKKCIVCKNDYYVRPSGSKQKFCSRKCHTIHHTRNKKCKLCGKEFTICKSDFNRRVFCSTKCVNEYKFNKHIELVCGVCGKKFKVQPCKQKRKYCSKECTGVAMRGRKNKQYKHGKTKLQIQIRQNPMYLKWRTAVFERDYFRCVHCMNRGCYNNQLNAHHIIPFKTIFEEYNIKTIEDAINCSFLWNIYNGKTVCEKCHKLIHKKI